MTDDGKTEDRGAMCRRVLQAAERGVLEIVCSSICLVEVVRPNPDADSRSLDIRDFFDNDYILLVDVDKQIGDHARTLMLAGHSRLKPVDAIHLATASTANAEEFHTFDEKLLTLNGKIERADSTPLRICKPAVPAPPAPLLDSID